MKRQAGRYAFLLICLLCSVAAQAQFSANIFWTEQAGLPASETIYYNPSYALNWKDFKGTPDNNAPAAAITASGFGYKADFKSVGTKSQLNVAVYCYFSKKNSWVKPGRTTEYILNHEQHHFDISFIAANMFADRLKVAGINRSNYNSILPKVYNECVALMNKMQNEYDGQTKNGQLQEAQAQWNELVRTKVKAITR
ncbi:MAG: hypothetical protein EOO06_15785 [Chitinophagaceae bacterium]|nr:MAG: hypothetical protein EOO06_15785 [Chitinophagaceae bacterium]